MQFDFLPTLHANQVAIFSACKKVTKISVNLYKIPALCRKGLKILSLYFQHFLIRIGVGVFLTLLLRLFYFMRFF